MSEAVRQATPIEVLERDLEDILSRPLKEEVKAKQIQNAFEKAKDYEQNYYNNQYVVINAHLKDVQTENKVLRTTNRVLASYIETLENGGRE